VNDSLIFWDSAPHLRICALGKLNKTFIGIDKDGYTEYEVIYLTKYLDNPVTIAELRNIPIVNEASFLKAGPATSVFPLTDEQSQILLNIILERNPYLLNNPSEIIINHINEINNSNIFEVAEGNTKLAKHIYKERNQSIIKAKKEYVLQHNGKLVCEICGFNYEIMYGELGKDFCEVHHKKAIADYKEEDSTTIDDLAILCANCHRMIHRTNPLMDLEKFKTKLQKRS
jgi:hypothetical protein